MIYQVGKWYPSVGTVRAEYKEYWKGILLSGKQIAVIINYRGARRGHYADFVDIRAGKIQYVGEGKKGDQTLNRRNEMLVQLAKDQGNVRVFFDCGDVSRQNICFIWEIGKLLATHTVRFKAEKIYIFNFEAKNQEISGSLKFFFGTLGVNQVFEKELRKFAAARAHMYTKFKSILRARDSIAGEIGEYFGISQFNKGNANFPLIRLRGSTKDIDAVQIKTGHRYAIKTIGKFPGTTSSIWSKSKNIKDAVDYFLIVFLDPNKLRPVFILQINAAKINGVLHRDNYQGSRKIKVTSGLIAKGKLIFGKAPK